MKIDPASFDNIDQFLLHYNVLQPYQLGIANIMCDLFGGTLAQKLIDCHYIKEDEMAHYESLYHLSESPPS